MALIKCPECGREISDKAASCPNCGCPASEFNKQPMPEDKQPEVDRIADEIFWGNPKNVNGNAVAFAKATGTSIGDSCGIMRARRAEWKKGKKNGKYPNTEYCPYCASQDIAPYDNPGIIVTNKANVFGGILISSQAKSTTWMRCNRCKCEWRPKKRK